MRSTNWRNFVKPVRSRKYAQIYQQGERFALTISKILANIWIHYHEVSTHKIFTRVSGIVNVGSVYVLRVLNGNLQIIKRLVRHDKGEELLPINDYCKFVGECGIRFGQRYSKLVSQNFEFITFVRRFNYINKFTEIRDVLLEWRQVLTGGIDTSFGHLVRYATPPKKHIETTAEELIEMCARNKFCYIKQPFIGHIHPVDVRSVKINYDAKPGFWTSKIFGPIRRFSYKRSVKVAIFMFKEICIRPMIYTGLWELGGREKDINLDKEGITPGTRIVMMCEEVLTLISSVFVQLYTNHIKIINNNCFFIGKSFNYENINYFKNLDNQYDFVADGDWKNFDADVTDEYILAACAILRRSLPDERKYHRYFFFIAASLIIKFVAVPANRVYKIMKGIPSGHGFTTLIGSFVNYLYLLKIGELIYGVGNVRGNMNFVIAGDDLKVWFKFHPRLLEVNSLIDENLPGECGDLLRNLIPCKHDLGVNIYTKFLKRKVDRFYNVYWDRRSFFRKVIYSKRRMRYFSEVRSWMLMWIETAPFDIEINNMIIHYIKYKLRDGTRLYDTHKDLLFDMIDKEYDVILRRSMYRILCPHAVTIVKRYEADTHNVANEHSDVYATGETMSQVDLIVHALINFGAGPITFYRKEFYSRIRDWSDLSGFATKSDPAYKYLVSRYYANCKRQYLHGFT